MRRRWNVCASCWAHIRLPAGAIRRSFAPAQGSEVWCKGPARVDLDKQHRNPEGGLWDPDDDEQLHPLRVWDGGERADLGAERDGSWGEHLWNATLLEGAAKSLYLRRRPDHP